MVKIYKILNLGENIVEEEIINADDIKFKCK